MVWKLKIRVGFICIVLRKPKTRVGEGGSGNLKPGWGGWFWKLKTRVGRVVSDLVSLKPGWGGGLKRGGY